MNNAPARRRSPAPGPSDRLRLHRWLTQAPGSAVAAAEVQLLDALLPNLFGYHLLQVGRLGGIDLLGASRILNRSIVEIDEREAAAVAWERDRAAGKPASTDGGPGRDAGGSSVQPGVVRLRQGPSADATDASGNVADGPSYPCVRGAPDALPFDSDAVDVVLLPHTLEFAGQPHEALREAMRVLVAEGHLVLCGFNPWSLLGLCARANAGLVPWRANLLGASRVRDWLKLLGLELLEVRTCFFRPPVHNPKLMARLEFIERFGRSAGARRLTAGLGAAAGVYVMVARKRVTTLTPVRARWRPRSRLVGVGLAGPSAQQRDAA